MKLEIAALFCSLGPHFVHHACASKMYSLSFSKIEEKCGCSLKTEPHFLPSSSSPHTMTTPKSSSSSPTQNPNLLTYQPISYIQSPFIRRNGCPRQSLITKHTIAYFDMPDESYIDQISQYTHLWILFHFHENRKSHKRMTKIRPPRLNGAKVGIYASRAPHRINDIGLSLVRLHHVEGKRIYLNGIDLLHGTPVLDVKPYVPYADAPPNVSSFANDYDEISKELHSVRKMMDEFKKPASREDECRAEKDSASYDQLLKRMDSLIQRVDSHGPVESSSCPSWVSRPQSQLSKIVMPQHIIDKIVKYSSEMEIYKDFTSANDIVQSIEEILMTDPRSVYRKQKCQDQEWWIHFDRLVLTLRMQSADVMAVIEVEYCTGDYMNPDRFLTQEQLEEKRKNEEKK